MGADLYIKSITEPARAKYGPLFNQAVEARNALMRDRQGFEAFVAIYDDIAVDLPSIRKQLELAKAKIVTIKANITAAQAEVEKWYNKMDGKGGYFRDSYNGTSILWRLGLSWWGDMIKSQHPSEDQLWAMRNRIRAIKLPPVTEAELKEMGCKVDNGENSIKTWQLMWRNKKRRLMRWLARAAKAKAAGADVYFSV